MTAFHAHPTASPYWAKHAPLTLAAGPGHPHRFLTTSPSALLAALGFHGHTTTAGAAPPHPEVPVPPALGEIKTQSTLTCFLALICWGP